MSEPSTHPPRCMHLRCKSMLVYGEAFEEDPEYNDGNTDWWCVQTGTNCGPDGGEASMPRCTQQDRSCYQEY